MAVGRSDTRTPGKHALLDKVLGREAGVVSRTPPFKSSPWVVVDLCAGDGRDDQASGTCSPRIMLRHASWLRRQGNRAHVLLIERNDSTYDILRDNVRVGADDRIICADSREPGTVPLGLWTRNSAVFVHNDPNSIKDFALSGNLIANLPRHTTTLSTLGCNVGGLKRLDPAERRAWFDHVQRVITMMPSNHDALLIALNGDDAQWAYLLTGPAVWRNRYESDVAKAFDWHKGVSHSWFRTEPGGFNRMCDELFLTRTERSA